MRQGDFFRALALLSVASAGAGLALVGASVTGHLGAITTVEEFVSVPSSSPARSDSSNGSLSIEEIYKLDSPGVVEISATSSAPRSAKPGTLETVRPLGTGFVIDKAGHVLTTSDLIAGVRSVMVGFSGGDQVNARVVGIDPATDIAVLQVNAHSRALTPLALGDSDQIEVGDPVVAIGNPLSFTRTTTAGIVSAVQRTIDSVSGAATIEHAIETDAAINHGDSGGPLINAHGQVIGVNAPDPSGAELRGGTVGLGFAIPIDTVKGVVAQLIHDGKVEHAYLGISAVPLTPTIARIFNLPSSRGLLIQHVVNGSAANDAGLRAGSTSVVLAGASYHIAGDIIVAADGKPIVSESQLRDVIEGLAPGDALRLQIWREGKQVSVVVTLGRPPG
jgi:S1-C subfamily serine protease